MAVVWYINSLAAVFRGLNKINVIISQILADNFLRLGADKSCGWEIMVFFHYSISLNIDVWGDVYGGFVFFVFFF